jgi:outer membrane receptor protein involved in Fe transport
LDEFRRASSATQVANPSSTPDTTTTTTTTATTTPVETAAPGTEQPIVLSPFEVDTTQDTGYRARNTLAGSRVSTPLSELASPISVVTKDFMDDIGAVDVNDILTYTVGTEGTKDFQSNTAQLGRTSDNVAQDPNGATRGRGLAAFDITRDYFYSLTEPNTGQSVGFDTYNLDNVTISRGADSILAGLGSPAGVINYAPQLALLNRNATDISYRFGSWGDKRAVLNTNVVAIPDVLAFRFAGVWKDVGYEQQPAYDHDKRYYLALTYKPFKKTTIHASYEWVYVNAHYPNTYTPEDDITQWLQLGKPSSQSYNSPPTGANVNYLYNGGQNGGNGLYPPDVYFESNRAFFSAFSSPQTGYVFDQQNLSNVGIWQPLRFSNDQYGNWHDLNINSTLQQNRLTTDEVSIDQEVFPHFSVNVAMVHEVSNNRSPANLGRPDYVQDQIDVNETLPWGAPNPYYGDTYMGYTGLDNSNATNESNLVVRASATYDLDLKKYNKWLGRYVFTGFAEDRRTESDYTDYNAEQPAGGAAITGGGPGIITYTGGTPANNYFQTTTPVEPFLFNSIPLTGANGVTTDTLSSIYTLKEEEKAITKLSTTAFVAQAYLLDDEVSGTFGLRRDKDEAGFLNSNTVTNGAIPALPSDQYSDGPLATVQAQTKTYGIVIHGPKIGSVDLRWLSVAYDQSQNFIPNAGSVDLLGGATPDPTGVTKDYSIMVDLLGGKLNAKIDWFTSLANGGPATTVNFPLVQWTMPFENLENNGENGRGSYYDLAVQAGHGADYTSGIDNNLTTGDNALANAYTENNVSKGMEFELTYNVTKNWRVFGTVTREQAEESNIAPALTTLINSRVAYWQSLGIWNGPYTTRQDWSGQPETGQQVYDTWVLPYVVAYQSAEGTPAQQLHKWKWSLVTNYTFGNGLAKGFGIGAGFRYLDKTIIGNPAIYTPVNGVPTVSGLNLANPYTTPGQMNVEAWVTYSRKVYNDKYLLTFRLESDTLQTSGGYTAVNANSDGTHQLFVITPPRTYYFTTELKF